MYTSLDGVHFWFTPSIVIFTFQECAVYPLNHTIQSINTIMIKHVVLSEIDENNNYIFILLYYVYCLHKIQRYDDLMELLCRAWNNNLKLVGHSLKAWTLQ